MKSFAKRLCSALRTAQNHEALAEPETGKRPESGKKRRLSDAVHVRTGEPGSPQLKERPRNRVKQILVIKGPATPRRLPKSCQSPSTTSPEPGRG